MAKFSQKVKGKEVGQADVYAQPHDMSGRPYTIADLGNGYGPSKGSAANRVNMSVGNITRDAYPEPKSTGIVTRGNGAATKGLKARGPMA